MKLEEIKELVNAYGWIDILSKNPHMISFLKEKTKDRMNVYFTTMTVTVQVEDGTCDIYKGVGLEKLEEILIKHK